MCGRCVPLTFQEMFFFLTWKKSRKSLSAHQSQNLFFVRRDKNEHWQQNNWLFGLCTLSMCLQKQLHDVRSDRLMGTFGSNVGRTTP